MKVFYHNDADGKCAANLVWRHVDFGKSGEYVEMDYDKEFPIGSIGLDEEIWIVDFSLESVDTMRALLEVTKNVHWVDHHVSSIEMYDDFGGSIKGLRSVEMSGCELTWMYILGHASGHRPTLHREKLSGAPEYARLIGDRDTWTFEYGDRSRYMHEAFKAAGEPDPKDEWWLRVSDGTEVVDELEKGKLLLDSTRAFYGAIVERSAYEATFEGHRILVCNCPIFTSEIFGDKLGDYPLVAVYCHNGKTWKVSLYSVNMDIVEYAKKRGGGGHPRACGFISDDVPFEEVSCS